MITHWAARVVPLPLPGAAPVPRYIAVDISEEVARQFLTAELAALATDEWRISAEIPEQSRSHEKRDLYLAYQHAAVAVEYGATAVEVAHVRYELTSAQTPEPNTE